MSAACSAYQYSQISKEDAKSLVKMFLNIGEININDRDTYLELKNLQTKSPFKDDCKSLRSYWRYPNQKSLYINYLDDTFLATSAVGTIIEIKLPDPLKIRGKAKVRRQSK